MSNPFKKLSTPEYSEFIYKSRYARWLDDKGRRENWDETIARYVGFWQDKYPNIDDSVYGELYEAIYNLEVMPSMRALMTAGPALDRDNCAGYNCAFIAIDDQRAFDEILYVLCCGTGAGFSVERQYINKLPCVSESFYNTETVIVPHDSKIGWATAFRELISLLYAGKVPKWDFSKIRPAGARLVTFGGRASGSAPLQGLFEFTIDIFKRASGRKLTSVECHDIICKIAEIVVCGGVRRCLPGTAQVPTDTGVKPIKDIKVGDKVVTGGKEYSVLEKVNSGIQKTIILKHRFGELECTPNHRVAVFISEGLYIFKDAANIVVGDRLVWDSFGTTGTEQYLPPLSEVLHFNAAKFTIPNIVDTEIAWLIGLIHGDGYIGPKGIEITKATNEINILEYALTLFEDYFSISGKISKGHGECVRLRICSSALGRWFLANIKQPNTDIRIPLFILNATKDIRASYLAGIFDSDGRGRSDGKIEQTTTIYKGFKDDLITILSALGIGCSIYEGSAQKRRDTGVDAKDFYTVSITGNTNRETWIRLVKPYIISDSLIELNGKSKSPIDFSYKVSMVDKNLSVQYKKDGNVLISSGYIEHNTGYLPTPVVEILQGREVETYDIQVEDIEQFTTNGIVVHNSALISLSNLSDNRMSTAKSGQWWIDNPQRALANNSVCYTEKPEISAFLQEWLNLYESKSGERGIVNNEAALKLMPERRYNLGHTEFGVNPCAEIVLRHNGQFCNLTEVIVRPNDSVETLKSKIRIASIIGTFQSTLTDFRYLRQQWKDNCEEERLLGVSLTGIMDHKVLNGSYIFDDKGYVEGEPNIINWLQEMRQVAVDTNKEWSEQLGVNQSTAVTCVKPSGTVSQLTDTASGIHPRYAPFYTRTVRADSKDPLAKLMVDNGVPNEPDVMKPDNTIVFSFPVRAPEGSVFRDDRTAIEQLELWKIYQLNYCEHKPSITVYVKEHEWITVAAWVYENFDIMSGVSFLPHSNHSYRQAPYQEITEEKYLEDLKKVVHPDWNDLSKYELEDQTTGSKELACAGGMCEI